MHVIIQTPIYVFSNDKFGAYSYANKEMAYETRTFVLSHEYNNGGIFTVTLTPFVKEKPLDQYALKFTVDYNTLNEIYKEPSKFITSVMNEYSPEINEMCDQVDNRDEAMKGFFFDPSYVTKLPRGFTVVTYTEPDGSKEVIAYCDDRNHVYTAEEKMTLDELLGVGCYKLLDCKTARHYIKNKDAELEQQESKASKSEETCYDHHSPEAEGFMNNFLNNLFKGKPKVEEF